MTLFGPYFVRAARGALLLGLAAAALWPAKATAQARSLAGGVGGFKGSLSSSSASSTSQSATAATASTAQAAQAAVTTSTAQRSLANSVAAFQKLAAQQMAAQMAASANNLVVTPGGSFSVTSQPASGATVINGLMPNGLNPVGGLQQAAASSIQIVNLSGSGKNQLTLSNGGTVALPSGTSGTDQVSVSGSGSVTSTSGNVSASAGSLTTTTGGTLGATNGGTISLTAGSATLSATTAATISSTVAGSYTPSGGTAVSFSANQAVTVPAGATVSFTGSSAATVTVAGAATVKLSGAGTLALSNGSAAAGGTIATNSGTTQFTNAVITSQPAGTTISLTGSGSIDFSGASSDVLPVILEANATTQSPPAFTTTGNVLQTTGYSLANTPWVGIGSLSQSVNSGGQIIDTVTQTQQQALLYWQTFNIGSNTTLDFDQSAGGASVGDWVAINRILDPSLNPTQILGAIQAPGQVYVINQNGIIFNGSSQINAHALVASTLPINTNLVNSGLLNNPGGEFLFSSQLVPTSNGVAAYDPTNDTSTFTTASGGTVTQANTLPNVASGSITVQEGASLFSPGSAEGVGGKIALIAPTIDNEGDLSAPDGQVILAAGQQVGFDAHPSSDPSLRGLDVAVGTADTGTALAAGDPAMDTVTNGTTGLIYAPEADVTLTAPAIVQNGVIESLTSTSLNGRIDLLAMSGLGPDSLNSYLFDAQGGTAVFGGTVDLGLNSVTEVLPDVADTTTEVGNSLALPSQVYVEGANFHMEQGADLIAPNATMTFSIGILNSPIANVSSGAASTAGETTKPLPEDLGGTSTVPFYLSTAGTVTLDAQADLDASGSSDVQASVTENILSVELTEAVLENSPLQRDGPMHGQTVTVDITQTGTNADGSTWFGSPIGDLSGYANLVEHSIGELTIAGGSVNINDSGAVNLGAGSTINVSGGSIDYQGAEVATTNLVAANGQIVNISQANPNVVYDGINTGATTTSAKWGVSQTISPSLESNETFDPGYVQGGAGGVLSIDASSVSLQGNLYGNTTQGLRQQLSPPKAGTFDLAFQSNLSGQNPPSINVVIQPSSDAQSTDPNTVDLSQDLFGLDGFSNASITTDAGKLTVAPDAVITAAPGASLSLVGANVEIDGQLYVPSGNITVQALSQPAFNGSGSYDPTIGNLSVNSGAVLSTGGLTFDETSGSVAVGTLPFSVNGGSVTISGVVTTLAAGSSVDASGGLARSEGGTLFDGKGGTVSISGVFTDASGGIDGQLVLDGALSAYGIGQGGSLNVKAPAVQVGAGAVAAFPGQVNPLVLPADFFGQGGFSTISVVAPDGVQITGGATIAPVLTEEVADTASGQFGVSLVSSSQLPSYPAAPVNLTFSAPGSSVSSVPFATVSMGANASITVAPTGSVTLSGQLISILGDITAPGGSITIGAAATGLQGAPEVTAYLGPQSSLSVSGEELTAPKQVGSQTYETGTVLPGGTISITGNIVGDAGASLLADGTEGTVDVPFSSSDSSLESSTLQQVISPYVSETIASNGGSITINGLEEAYFAGNLSAKPGNSSATGGTLTFGSSLAPIFTPTPNAGLPELFIQQSGTFTTGPVTLGQALTSASQNGGGYFTIQQFNNGGFGSLILKGNVEFENGDTNPITISASQEVQIIPDSVNGTVFADGTNETVTINAPYIAIGATSLTIAQQSVSADAPAYVGFNSSTGSVTATPTLGLADPAYGNATLALNASDLIDVGFLSLQNFGVANLSVPTGDIRGGGLFYAAGTINLAAGQIYTPTAASFTVAAFGSDNSVNGGVINITNPDDLTRPLPLSAGGTLNVYATTINQDGTLVAPFGIINLGALPNPGTGETPALAGISFSLDQIDGKYDLGTAVTTQQAPVTGTLTLGANSVTSVSGVSSTGQALDLPFGTILNGNEWIAPNGADITAGGLPAKAVNLEANSVNDAAGSLINLTGGGDLFAYSFNPGVGGTNDILSMFKYSNGAIVKTSSGASVDSSSFAIVPTYGLNYAPIDLTIDDSLAEPYAAAAGNPSSKIGEEIYLAGGDGIAAGTYAILPARYALLTGAYLVEPASATPAQTSVNPDGSINMAGYVYNSLNTSAQIVPNVSGFTLSSSTVVNNAAPYTVESANSFLAASALANNQAVPRLPRDAGQLAFDATAGLQIGGALDGEAGPGGLGSIVDIGSSDDIYIVSNQGDVPTLTIPNGVNPADYDYLTLSAGQLDAFGADSLLIGGTRLTTTSGTTINPMTDAIYVENGSTTPLSGDEVILVSNKTINLASGSSIQQSGVASTDQENLTIGNASTVGSGDGTLIRVTGDAGATFTRLGVNTSDTAPNLTLGAGASISGVAVTLDSSNGTTIDPAALLDQNPNVKAQSLVLSSGTISLQVDPNVSVAGVQGLVLESAALQSLETSVASLSLSSYSSINLYGAGTIGALDANGQPAIQSLTLLGAGIFGYDNAGGTVTINAQNVTLGNPGNQVLPGSVPTLNGGSTLAINANTINFGANALAIDGFGTVQLNANDGMLVSGTGALNAQGALVLATSEITGATSANYTFNAQGGALTLTQPATTGTVSVTGGLGTSITFEGSSVTLGSTVFAPSGTITAVASTGTVEVTSTGTLDVSGQAVAFGGALGYTNGGTVNLTATSGAVNVDAGALVNVSASNAGNGNAGTINLSAPNGTAILADGALSGTGGATGTGGTFNATVGQAPLLSVLTTPLTDGGFQNMTIDVQTGSTTVDGEVGSFIGQNGITSFSLTTEAGSISVDNTINASGVTGGMIGLYSDEGVDLTSSAVLSVTGQKFNDAGQGGTIDIETRGDNGGVLNLESGAQLLLGVGSGNAVTAAGTVHLRAPQTQGGTPLALNSSAVADGLAIDSIAATIANPGSVVVEAYRVYQPSDGTIDSVEPQVTSDVANFPTAALATHLGVSGNPLYQIQPGVEIINPNGNLTLQSNWDLSSLRSGAGLPGILTIRASGNLIFDGSLTDGFAYNANDAENVANSPYTWDLLPAGSESWSYRLVSGAQFNAAQASTANFGEVQSLAALGLSNSSLYNASTPAGSLQLGQVIPVGFDYGATTAQTAATYAQLIRTGTGNITIDTGGSIELMNTMATIYTAGQLAPAIANFDSPTGVSDSKYETFVYGTTLAPAPQYTAQYSENGGNISLNAGQDIVHLTEDSNGQLVLDTSWQFPTNWLNRRGATSSAGVFDTTRFKRSTEIASTTWWVNFSNFFEGIGALGGGNVSLDAGGNIVNVDAVVPTNARMPFNSDSASSLVELGGGDLSVIAAGTIEGGTYYVERGTGFIDASTIETGAADSVRVSAQDFSQGLDTPLPLTLFVGDSSFTVEATNDVTLGSTVNPFLLPQGIDNGFGDESIFSTYGPTSSVSVASLLGSISIQGSQYQGNSLPGGLANAYLSNASPGGLSRGMSDEESLNPEPWTLTLDPNLVDTIGIDHVTDYSNFYNLSPPVFNATAFSGNIQYLSDQTLASSAQGTMHLLAAGTIEGAFDSSTIGNGLTASITILDDDPSQFPSVINPLGLGESTVEPGGANSFNPSIGQYIENVYGFIGETPSSQGETLSELQGQHTPGLLHNDTPTTPVEIETATGDIEDFTLISPEKTDISSGLDLEDVSLYLQNNNANDITSVTANRNIVLFDPDSAGLLQLNTPNSVNEAFGDIQLSGPGTLEVLAGGNLNLGESSSSNGGSDTHLGITTIGNTRNPYLPFGGAQIITAAGLGDTSGLDSNPQLVNYEGYTDSEGVFHPGFISEFLDPSASASSVYLPDLGQLLGFSGATDQQIWDIFSGNPDGTLTQPEQQLQSSLTPEARDGYASTIFYDVLRDAGRAHNLSGSYAPGFAAIADLFPAANAYSGNISLTSREIKTTNGGDIDMLLPGGAVDVGLNNLGTQAVDQGILTVDGGNISIFANGSVNIGTSRIFTLHGGNVIIWSSTGDIDAGAASRTVQSAPPTEVEVDSQSANVQTDLAGLATGGGIGVLETVVGAPPGNVDLIAPVGTVNAGDAGIRASGNVNVAAAQVLNAGNIQAGGSKTGVGSTATPNVSAAVAGSSAAGSSQNAAAASQNQGQNNTAQQQDLPSQISVYDIGYGGGDDSASNDTPSDRKLSRATYLADHPTEASAAKF